MAGKYGKGKMKGKSGNKGSKKRPYSQMDASKAVRGSGGSKKK